MELQLVIIAGPEAGRVIPLVDGKTLVIGRGGASDTQINDPRMSRAHCVVQVDGGKVVLTDSDSASGTLVDGKRIDKQELQVGQVFQAGDTQFRLQLQGPLEASRALKIMHRYYGGWLGRRSGSRLRRAGTPRSWISFSTGMMPKDCPM